MKTVDKELKHKITERWHIISHGPFPDTEIMKAVAQLEYILTEAGLLAQRRAPRGKREQQLVLSEEMTADGARK